MENEADFRLYIILGCDGHADHDSAGQSVLRDRDYSGMFSYKLLPVRLLGKNGKKRAIRNTDSPACLVMVTKLSQLYQILNRKYKHIISVEHR